MAVPMLRRSVTGLSSRSPGFGSGTLHVEIYVEQSGTDLGVILSVMPPMLHTHLCLKLLISEGQAGEGL